MARRERRTPVDRDAPPRLGTIAVNLGYITSGQLKEALMEQVDDDLAGRPHRILGHILLDRGWLTLRQLEDALDKTLEAGGQAPSLRRRPP